MLIPFKLKNLIVLSIIPLAYILICLFMFISQRHLMYFPYITNQLQESVWKKLIVNNTLLGIESLDNKKDTVIIFHGNAGNAAMRHYYFNLVPKKYHIIVAEYPGFGLNSEKELGKESILNDARILVADVKKRSKGEVVLIGESLGTGVASEMAKEFNIEKLFLITPYSSIADVAQKRYWYLPISLLIKDNFNSMQSLEEYKGKTLLLISEKDKVIPPEFADKLYKNISGRKDKIVVANAGHSSWMKNMTPEQVNKVNTFLN